MAAVANEHEKNVRIFKSVCAMMLLNLHFSMGTWTQSTINMKNAGVSDPITWIMQKLLFIGISFNSFYNTHLYIMTINWL